MKYMELRNSVVLLFERLAVIKYCEFKLVGVVAFWFFTNEKKTIVKFFAVIKLKKTLKR